MKEYSIYTEYNVHQRAMNLKGSRNIAFGNMMEKAQLQVSVRMLCLVKITGGLLQLVMQNLRII